MTFRMCCHILNRRVVVVRKVDPEVAARIDVSCDETLVESKVMAEWGGTSLFVPFQEIGKEGIKGELF
jgi:hypothetical protein